jgi:hypothetical protein
LPFRHLPWRAEFTPRAGTRQPHQSTFFAVSVLVLMPTNRDD